MEPTIAEAFPETERAATLDKNPNCPRSFVRHVLVPLDGSHLAECVLPFAAAAARAFGARITLLRVLEPHGEPGVAHDDPVVWEINQTTARSELMHVAAELEASGTPSTVEIAAGRAAEQILRVAAQAHVDLIVLSSHGEGGLSRWRLSGTVHKVALQAPSSVLIVPAYACSERRLGRVRLAKILIPLDCSPRAECILPVALALARADDAELILAHVVPEPELPRRLGASASDIALASQLTEHNRTEANRYLSDLQRQMEAQGARARVRVVVAPRCAHAVRALADMEDVELLLLCAHGRTGDQHERYGTIASSLLQSSSRPILLFQDFADVCSMSSPAREAAREHPGH